MSLTSYQAAPPCNKGTANLSFGVVGVKRDFFESPHLLA
jgi:hypothetical protein